jgi:hypothetical protein
MPTVEDISALPKLTLNRPPRSCRDELLRPELCAAVPRMAVLIDDVDFKAQQLAYEDVPIVLPPDELFALVAYTYDTQSGKDEPDGELYYELNTALRKRKPDERKLALATWGGFLYYLLSALSKLADVQTVVYRGYPDKATVLDKYKVGRSAACNSETVRVGTPCCNTTHGVPTRQVGRPIQWGAFSSTSRDVAVTKQFTSKPDGVIFKLTLCAGKAIQAYSYFAAEAEVLISPQARFTVASAPYEGADGYTYVDMVETRGTLFIS